MSLTDTQRVEDDGKVRRSPESLSSAPETLPGGDGGNGANVEIQDGGRGSTNPSPALGGTIQPQQMSLPVMTNRPPSVTNRPPSATNRPPSVASTHSAASNSVNGSAPRLTTTSRRGGRARSRSPVSNVGRPGSRTSNRDDFMGAGEPFTSDGRSSRNAASPANPSSAAAAAAAAAKALSNSRGAGRGHHPSWYDNGHQGGGHRSGENPRYRQQSGFDNSFGGPHSWQVAEGRDARRGDQRSLPISYQNSGQGQFKRYDDRPDISGQYGDQRNNRSSDRLTPPVPPGQYNPDRRHRQNTSEDYYQGLGGMAPVNDGPDLTARKPEHVRDVDNSKRPGSTNRVIGTPTPIHVPRASDAPGSARQDGTPSSVFRGRPSSAGGGSGAVEDDNSPQKILLSLRTPTTSFEEAGNKKGAKGAPYSPEEPPRIQNAHHQNHMDASLFFEPHRSPKHQSGTLEMAPSFSLFNQSFDSLGDSPHYLNVGAPLDATFNSGSFGTGPSGSNEMENGGPQFLPNSNIHRNPSGTGGSFGAAFPPSQPPPILGGSSSGGVMTFGSPVNSFGNGAPSNLGRRAGNMMLLGGSDARSSSPTQMLNMYPSYSGGYGGSQPHGQSPPFRNRGVLGNNHMRSMSSGSFGGASLLHAYTPRSFGAEGNPHGSFHSPEAARSPEGYTGPPRFYVFLRRHKGAFIKCSFLLPGLKAALLESPISDKKGGEKGGRGRSNKRGQQPPSLSVHMGMGSGRGFADPSPHETAIAMRRVVCAVCAFGGTTSADRRVNLNSTTPESSQSIFRKKSSDADQTSPAAVTPSSTMGTPPGSRTDSRSKARYDEMLSSRYYENENRLSWEFEESPPVGSASEDEEERRNSSRKNKHSDGKDGRSVEGSKRLKTSSDGDESSKQGDMVDGGKKIVTPGQDQPKMRYRCKLCGLPKQNHTCAYQQSLQRSIGVMVYPAVNAFIASEPGSLAPPLDDMNNFVLGGGESVSSGDGSPSRPSPDRSRITSDGNIGSGSASTQVTPDTLRSGGKGQNSPGASSMSTGTATPQGTPYRTPKSQREKGDAFVKRGTPGSANRPKRALGGGPGDADLLFMESMELKPEQFRLISTSKQAPLPDAYTYASLPLPYAQRKRLSDNLFALSKEVPQLTDECAVVLREAREKDMWDLAVAELMTQVVVIIHCRDGDSRFEGLRQYLVTMGISC